MTTAEWVEMWIDHWEDELERTLDYLAFLNKRTDYHEIKATVESQDIALENLDCLYELRRQAA